MGLLDSKLLFTKNDNDIANFWFNQAMTNKKYLRLRTQWRYFALFLLFANVMLTRFLPLYAKLILYFLQALVVIIYRVYFWVVWRASLPSNDKQQYYKLKRTQLLRMADLLLLAVVAFIIVIVPLLIYAFVKSNGH